MSSATYTLDEQIRADDEQIKSLVAQINYNQIQIANCPKRYDDMQEHLQRTHIALNKELNAVKKSQGDRRTQLAQYQHEEYMLLKDAEMKRERILLKESEAQPSPQYQATPGGNTTKPDPKAQEFLDSLAPKKVNVFEDVKEGLLDAIEYEKKKQ